MYNIAGFQYSLILHPKVQPDTLKQLNDDWSGSDISMFQTIMVLAYWFIINLLDPQLVGHKPCQTEKMQISYSQAQYFIPPVPVFSSDYLIN